MKGMFMKVIFMVAWLVSSLAAINVGLAPFNFDFFRTEFFLMNMSNLAAPICYLILASGLISLASFVMSCTRGKHKDSSSCGC